MKPFRKNIFFICFMIALYSFPLSVWAHANTIFEEEKESGIYPEGLFRRDNKKIFRDDDEDEKSVRNYFETIKETEAMANEYFNETDDWDSGLAIGEEVLPLEDGIYLLFIVPWVYTFLLKIKRRKRVD